MSIFPQTIVQTCIVHLIRNSVAFVSWKDRKAILPAIKANLPGRERRYCACPPRGIRG